MRISDWSSDVCSSDLQREQLAEMAEAVVHRFAPQAHDFRPWQGPGDETGVQEIVWQLVDETRRPPGIWAGAFEVTGAKLCPVDARRARDAIQVEHLRRTATRGLFEGGAEILEFACRMHLRVAGQDAVDQRRAGARHANHEDRLVAVVAHG